MSEKYIVKLAYELNLYSVFIGSTEILQKATSNSKMTRINKIIYEHNVTVTDWLIS